MKLNGLSNEAIGAIAQAKAILESQRHKARQEEEARLADEVYDTGHGVDCCSLCGGDLGVLGKLGNMVHLLCRDCGMQFSREDER